jgi:hypothetical protein
MCSSNTCFSANCGSEDVDACCCIDNLRFILYCLAYSAFLCFLTLSMPVSVILVTRHAFNTILYHEPHRIANRYVRYGKHGSL